MTVGSKIARWANVAFGSITSLGLIYAYVKYVYPLISKRSWGIVFLSLFVLFLLFLIGAIKRVHERTVNTSVWIAEHLSSRAAMIEEYFVCLQPKQLADKEYLEAWLNGAAHDIRDCLGDHAVKGFYDGSDVGKPPPENIEAQILWMRRYAGKLRMIIKDQYITVPPVRMSKKKRKMIEEAKDSARAWAEKQNRNTERRRETTRS